MSYDLTYKQTNKDYYFKYKDTLADASHAPETKVFWSGDKERDMTSPVWPPNDVTCCPVSMSHKTLE